MPHFLFQWKYKDPALKAMLETMQDRPVELAKAVEGFGGKVNQFYFAFGEYDGVAIVEFPTNESCIACSLTLGGGGANTALETTVLISPDEGARAMRLARETKTGYRSPIGYSSHG